MSDVYFIQVKGTGSMFEETANRLLDQIEDMETDDNVVIVPEEIEPLDESHAREYLEEMANALDMEVSDEKSG